MPQLPVAVISDAEEELAHNEWNTIERVQARLKAWGITVPDQPPNFAIPEVTTTLVDSDNQEYLKTNAQYLAWLNFITPHIALTKGIILQIQNEKKHIEALYRQNAREADKRLGRGKKTPKEEIDDSIMLDPRYIALTRQEQELIQERDGLESKETALERTMRVISRHVEVKKLDAEMNRVGMGLPQRHPYTFGRRE